MVHRIQKAAPEIHETVFIAHNAEVAGNVTLAEGASVWFSASIRGDIAPIFIGKNSNIQDGAVLHCDFDIPCSIGEGVTIGHGAIVHSARIGNNSIIGMGAIILGNTEIGEDSIVGAGTLITGGKKFPPRSMIFGNPAKKVRDLTDAEITANRENAHHYTVLAATAGEDYQDMERK